VFQYNLSIQREIMRNTVLEVGYVGSQGTKLYLTYNPNQQRVYQDFLPAFKELQAFQTNSSAPISPNNTLVKIFGTPASAISALGAANFTQGQVGTAASNLDTLGANFNRYPAAGVSQFYMRNYPQYINVQQGTNSGRAYYNSGQSDRAAATFEALLDVDPSSHFGHYGLGQSLKRLGRRSEAGTHLRLAIALSPDTRLYRDALARLGSGPPTPDADTR